MEITNPDELDLIVHRICQSTKRMPGIYECSHHEASKRKMFALRWIHHSNAVDKERAFLPRVRHLGEYTMWNSPDTLTKYSNQNFVLRFLRRVFA